MTRARGSIHRFADFVDRSIDESERSSIATFNDLSPQMLGEVKAVRRRGGPLAACEYLRFFIATQDSGDAEDFCEDVVERGADAMTWKINDRVIELFEPQREALGLTVGECIAAFDGVKGERWVQYRLHGGPSDKIPISRSGPGVLVHAVHYWTDLGIPKRKARLRACLVDPRSGVVERIPETDIDVAIRRWITTCAAWWARAYLTAEAPHATVGGIVAAYPEPVTPSADGLVALHALVQEARSGDPRWPGQVGYIGPDAWYRA